MKTLEEIKQILHDHSGDLRQRYGINRISVFGSVVRGQARADSDVDIMVEFDGPMSLLSFIDAEYYISELLGCKVDLVPARSVRRELRDRINNEAVPV